MRGDAALFDFDGTLCPGDSIVAWIRFCVREGAAPASQWLRAARGYAMQRLDPRKVRRAKEDSLSFIRGRAREDMDALARRFLERELKPRLRPEGLREIERLRRDGLRIVVLSASTDVYMRLLPEIVPADDVLATPCLLDADGRYTGKMGENCRGAEKVRRWREFSAREGLRALRAYGDSPGDAPMLREAEQPVWVNAGRRELRLLPEAERVTW